jgi:hypothetical protein
VVLEILLPLLQARVYILEKDARTGNEKERKM